MKPRVILLGATLVGSIFLTLPAAAQTSLGEQRVGTASGTFLKIGVDARGAALGGSYVALVDGALAPFYNPAGLAMMATREFSFGFVRWPADIDIFAASFARPFGDEGPTLRTSA